MRGLLFAGADSAVAVVAGADSDVSLLDRHHPLRSHGRHGVIKFTPRGGGTTQHDASPSRERRDAT